MLGWYKNYIIVISFVLLCNGQRESRQGKTKTVERIVQKIFNLTSKSLQIANSEEKEEIMKKIERKLVKSAEPLGPRADKYVKLIMQGLQLLAKNQNQKHVNLDPLNLNTQSVLRDGNRSEVMDPSTSKDRAAQQLADKILKLAENYFEESGHKKRKIMEDIKERILETANQRHDLIHVKHDKIKKYTDLLTRGMELMMKKLSKEVKKSGKRRMIMEFVNARKIPEQDDDNEEENNNGVQMKDIIYKSQPLNKLQDHTHSTTTQSNLERGGGVLTTMLSCNEVFYQTCLDIKSLNEVVCTDKKLTVHLNKLCDGVTDCADGSDEEDCVNKAMDRLQTATFLVSRIEIYLVRNCFLSDNNDLLIKQNTVLNEVLQRQIRFLNKYKMMNRNSLELSDAFAFKRTLGEVVVVINTLAVALESSLCIQYNNKKRAEQDARKSNLYQFEPDDLNNISDNPPVKFPLKSCICIESFCANSTCAEACKRVCWHKYNLGRWVCQAVDEGTSVSLDTVCDGKLDCYDESDETSCYTGSSNAKFEANKFFDDVLKTINMKAGVKDYLAVKSKLMSLGASVIKLQKTVMEPKIDEGQIKNARDECFTSYVSIYKELVSKALDINELEDAHGFLLTMNEKLMAALKRTHTGNDRIMSPDGCYCRRGRCAATSCSANCKRACAVSPKLTRYWCKNIPHKNISVPLDGICNGVPNCPLKDDEDLCSPDVCRKHHIMLLRHNIRDVGEKLKGTSLGEALRAWKAKATSTVKITENNYKPGVNVMKELVGSILHDLVMIYSTLDDTRRAGSDYVFKEFFSVSQLVIENLKSCTM